jgi:aarF domain-containing kinase
MADSPFKPLRIAPVPQGRARRFLHLGRAVGELAAGAAAEGLSRLARGERPDVAQLLLAPSNARRLAERLSQMRGAVMKVGQLMSMDGHGVLPPQFAELLAGLRDRAHVMPPSQLARVLQSEYGAGWQQRFKRFDFEPIAAASIGQVHRAETHDGRMLALKVQYPGVRASIDSDVANLALLARTPGLVPAGIDVTPLLARVRDQLLHETDYRAEAAAATEYRLRLGDDPVLTVPMVHTDLSTAHILATDFAPGVPIDRLEHGAFAEVQRNHVAVALARLAVREFFDMQLVQTDPNFGNYLFDADSGHIALIDFGATESVAPARIEQLRELGRALRADDRARTTAAALAVGFVAATDTPAQARGIVDMMLLAGEPLRHVGPYDFGASTLFSRSFAHGKAQFFDAGFGSTPPPDLLFLQRKFIGTFMLCARLRARADVAEWFGSHL